MYEWCSEEANSRSAVGRMAAEATDIAAVRDAATVLTGLDEEQLEGASIEQKQTWRLVEILLEQMPGRAIPFEDRSTILSKWRKVIVVAQEDQRDAELRLASGVVADEHDTPGGALPLLLGNNSLKTEFGLWYRLPKELIEEISLTVTDDEEEELEDAPAPAPAPAPARSARRCGCGGYM